MLTNLQPNLCIYHSHFIHYLTSRSVQHCAVSVQCYGCGCITVVQLLLLYVASVIKQLLSIAYKGYISMLRIRVCL